MDQSVKLDTKFEGAAAVDFGVLSDGAVEFSIPFEPGGPEYLWFYFKVIGDNSNQPEFILKNAAGAHQTGKRWNITRPVFSADGSTWVRADQTSYRDVLGLGRLLGRKPVFRFRSPISTDTLWVAYCYPYTLTQLDSYVKSLANHPELTFTTLGKSEEGRDIPRLIIQSNRDVDVTNRKSIWIICREHPGETPASYVCEGMVSALLVHPAGRRLLSQYQFNVIPILNVDGVAHGYYYHNANGVNLALDWDHFRSIEVKAVEAALRADLEQHRVPLMVNLHSSNDPTKGHFFLEIPENRLNPSLIKLQRELLRSAGRKHPQLQAKSTVRLLEDAGITGNAMNSRFGVYCLYLESNYSLGADGSDVTPESLREVGTALVLVIAEVLAPE
ncbi:MAG: M14-type cytosolic carboxypeptidase [bacterium]|nr:M14-type cytosolic carboxypeptidase [bacterium]